MHIYDLKFALPILKHYWVKKYGILILFTQISIIFMCLCHLYHKWHKHNNGHNSVVKVYLLK